MSFFYDFLKYFDIKDLDAKTTITTIIGLGIVVIGKIKIKNIQENEVKFSANKKVISVCGENLSIKTISKGELVIRGEVKKIEMEWLCQILFV